ncbi:MAG: halocarboxylic acid dehydrogenase DehI family protein, partial [Candidatus Angelobacter sp.]
MPWKRHKLRAIKESQADLATSEIYSEIKQALGIPHVNMIFQVLASFPKFLPLFWNAARPLIDTREFFSSADRLGAEAYTRMHNYFSIPDLRGKVEEMQFSSGAERELKDVVELYHYDYPVLLLLCAAQIQAFENPEASVRQATSPAGPPQLSDRAILVDEENAPAPTRKIYEDIKRTLGTPFLNTCYINFGRWPDFLREYWDQLKPVMATPQYQQHCSAIRDSALALASELPQPLQLSASEMEEAGIARDDLSTIVQTTESFRDL